MDASFGVFGFRSAEGCGRLLSMAFNRDRKYPAYIFDCDGTLADSMPLHLLAWNHALEHVNAPLRLERDSFMTVAGMALQQTIDHWNELHDTQIDGEVVIRVKNDYVQKHLAKIRGFDDAIGWAKELHERGEKLAVASGGTREDIEFTLKHLGIRQYFEAVVTADDVKLAKPEPDLFLEAARQLGVPPEGCLVFEDSLLGKRAADACGMDCVMVDTWRGFDQTGEFAE
ncbi:MAG: HAD family phosphatase [Verrucomicrobiota bacterium JB022]|nr:HAD family phosphatase [Verrucomicrobiota bacterium JB022]